MNEETDRKQPTERPTLPTGVNPFRETETGDRIRKLATELGVEPLIAAAALLRETMKHDCEIEPVIELARLLLTIWRHATAEDRAFLTSPTFRSVLCAMGGVPLMAAQVAGLVSDLSTMLGQVDALQVKP